MNFENFKKFIEAIKNTDIEELRIEKPDLKINFKRSEFVNIELPKNSTQPTLPTQKWKYIKSPTVGRFYRAHTPQHPPLVMENDFVKIGQRVAVIEQMKILKDVVAMEEGKVVKILVDNGQTVEYGQNLIQLSSD